jgi:hypothetical protein
MTNSAASFSVTLKQIDDDVQGLGYYRSAGCRSDYLRPVPTDRKPQMKSSAGQQVYAIENNGNFAS